RATNRVLYRISGRLLFPVVAEVDSAIHTDVQHYRQDYWFFCIRCRFYLLLLACGPPRRSMEGAAATQAARHRAGTPAPSTTRERQGMFKTGERAMKTLLSSTAIALLLASAPGFAQQTGPEGLDQQMEQRTEQMREQAEEQREGARQDREDRMDAARREREALREEADQRREAAREDAEKRQDAARERVDEQQKANEERHDA